MDIDMSPPAVNATAMFSKRKREPYDYREYRPSSSAPRKRRKSIADYTRCSAQQQHMYDAQLYMSFQSLIDDTRYHQNSVCSPLLRLPAEIRNEIYSHVLSNQVIHISVRECPIDDSCSWSHAVYYRTHKHRCKALDSDRTSFLKFTHSLCTLPFEEEDHAHARAAHRNRSTKSNSNENPVEAKTSYRIRHKPCYRSLARLKANWLRDGSHVTLSPNFRPASSPGLSVSFLQTCRQIYSEARDLVYMSNTFAFHEGNTLDLFLSKCLSPSQRGLVSSIQLDGWNSEDYDPGRKVRPATLQHLSGLKLLNVAVTNAYFFHYTDIRFRPFAESEESKAQKDQAVVVKVTVDRLDVGWVEVSELERVLQRNIEVALGLS